MSTGGAGRRAAALTLMAASGFAGLGYQIVWTRQCALWLGHEAAAVLAVVAAFFGGLALGAWLLGRRIEQSPRPVRWYAGCELVIGLWSLALIGLMSPATDGLLGLTGAQPSSLWQWSVAFWGTFLLLLPATAAMGATLPAMERIVRAWVGALYAGNTAGAVVGVLAAAFWLIPGFGLARTVAICATLNLVCAAASLVVFSSDLHAHPVQRLRGTGGPSRGAVLARLAATGLLGIGYEVIVVRVLGQVTENTVYTFALLLAVYLVGTTAGAAVYQRWLARRDPRGDGLLAALAAACLLGTATLWAAPDVVAWATRLLGGGAGAAIAAEALPALLAFGLPTAAMGAVFSHLACQAIATGVGLGRALGTNTVGAAAAPALFGVLAFPALGPKLALVVIAVGYLALTVPRTWSRPVVWLPAAAALALAVAAPPLVFVDVPPGGRLVRYADGITASVSVVEDHSGVSRLRINNRQQEGSSATGRLDARLAWLPLLLHPSPRNALFLGLGTGVTAAAAAEELTLDVEAVELLPEVIEASAWFVPRGSRLRVLTADARRYVRVAPRRHDVIVSDNFHPARSGSGSLYTVEHFAAVRERLTAGGLFCQWLPLHQLDLRTMRSIVRSFLEAFPQGAALLASNSLETPIVGLIAVRDAGRFEAAAVRRRLSGAPAAVPALGLEDELAVLGSLVASSVSLRGFAGDAALNTDDRPVVAYRAPLATYAPEARPGDRLIALLSALSAHPDALVATDDPRWRLRLAAYWEARKRFVESGRDVRPAPTVEQMLGQVREPLLAVLRVSPDFRPAYDPLLAMAAALARSDRNAARSLLADLTRIQPARAEASQALRSLTE